MNRPISKKQIIMIKTLIGKLNAQDGTSEDLALAYSNGRTDRISLLYKEETQDLINWLLNANGQSENPAVKMRRKILSMAHEMKWEKTDGKIDMERVNNWCHRYGFRHRDLDQYTVHDLPELVTQFEKAYKSFLTSL